jgi:MFS family permease
MNFVKEITVEPIAFLYMLSTFAEYTTVQDLVFVKFCSKLLNESNSHINDCIDLNQNITNELSVIETKTTQLLISYNTILYLTAIISSFIAGSYGDSFGRIAPLLWPSFGSLISQLILITISFNIDSNINTFNVFLLFCAFISGISGGSSSLMTNAFGFISDITQENERTIRIVALETSIFFGGFVGYSLTAFLLKSFITYRYLISFSLIFTIHLFILFYIILRLRHFNDNQSLSSVQNSFQLKKLYSMLSDVFKTVFKKRNSNNRKLILLLMVCFVLTSYGVVVQTSLLFLYVRNRPLVWDSSLYAYFSGIKFGVSGLALCLLPLIQFYYFPNICDTFIAIIGLFSRTCGLIMIGFANNTILMFSSIILLIFSEYPLPAIRSLLSKLVAIDEKGKVFAFLSSLQNICLFTGGIIFPLIYKNEVINNSYAGLSFEITAIFQIIALLFFM